MNVSIVIPNYNGSKLLQKNLLKVIAKVSSAQIIVVDDGSKDDSVKMLGNHFPQVTVIKRKNNSGFSSCVNDGVRIAKNKLVFLLNHDAYPENNFLDFLLPYFDNPKVFAVGCLEKSIEGKKIISRGRGVGFFHNGFLQHKRGEINKNNTLWVSGGSGMFRKDTWLELGGLDQLYNPFYWEDIDLSYRAQKAGYEIFFEPRSIIFHAHQEGIIRSKFTHREIKIIAYRNQILFVWLNINNLHFFLEHLIYLPIHLIRSIISLDFPFIYGLILAIIKLPKVLANRKNNNRNNKITDRDILEKFTGEV